MGIFKEFKDFISRGNVVDLAVGVIVGGAFGKIVSSLVGDLIMPPIGLLLGKVNFTDLKLVLNGPGSNGHAPVTINYGNSLQAGLDFLIVSLAVFVLVQAINRIRRKVEGEKPAPAPAPSPEEKLLTEIRDLLKAGAGQNPRP